MLTSVHGPRDSKVFFDYERPLFHPFELNETYLVRGSREQGLFGEPRSFEYEYLWPQVNETPGETSFLSFWAMADEVYEIYRTFYARQVSCTAVYPQESSDACSDYRGHIEHRRENPCAYAEQQQYAYLSNVADNIVRVWRNGNIEVESEYDIEPKSHGFDHIVAQRYGGEEIDSSGNGWLSGFPTFALDYFGGDFTHRTGEEGASASIPGILRTRYRPEPFPSSDDTDFHEKVADMELSRQRLQTSLWQDEILDDDVCPSSGDDSSDDEIMCWMGEPSVLLDELFDHESLLPYYDLPDEDGRPRLLGTPLTCEQLARVQLADPRHNDTHWDYEPVLRNGQESQDSWECDEFVLEEVLDQDILDHRGECNRWARVFQCLARISVWVRTDEETFWLNEAARRYKDPGTEDSLPGFFDQPVISCPNADEVLTPGYQLPQYDTPVYEIVSYRRHREQLGRERVEKNMRRICAWTRTLDRDGDERWYGLNYRGQTLVEAVKEPDVLGDLIFTEFIYNADGNLIEYRKPVVATTREIASSFTRFEYDDRTPLTSAEWSEDLEYWTRRHNLLRVEEVALDGIVHAAPDGGTYTSQGRTAVYAYEPVYNQITTVTLYDGRESLGSATPFLRTNFAYDHDVVPGRPTEIVTQTPREWRTTLLDWAPHGLPKTIQTPDGATTRHFYYGTKPGFASQGPQSFFGTDSQPQDLDIDPDARGMLARVEVNQFDAGFAEKATAALGDIFGAPCTPDHGPYAFLGSRDCSLKYRTLGLPEETIKHLENVPHGPLHRTELSYDITGHLRNVWDDGRHSQMIRDSDGRVWLSTDPVGNQTTLTYSLDGQPILAETTHSNEVLHQVERRFDNEGRLLAQCTAIMAQGCHGVIDALAPDEIAAPPLDAPGETPSHALEQWRYTPEGHLQIHRDAQGLITSFGHNARGQVTAIQSLGAFEIRDQSRTYDEHGRLTGVFHGTLEGLADPGILFETFDYDVFDRLVEHTDTRRKVWTSSYDVLDNLVRRLHVGTGWNETRTYNGHGELLTQRLREPGAGETTTEYIRLDGGQLVAINTTGVAPVLTALDIRGNPVFSLDGEGNMQVTTWHGRSRTGTRATLRKDPDGGFLTTAAVTRHDLNHLPVETQIFGDGRLRRLETWERDTLGRVREHKNPEGVTMAYDAYTLTGWPLAESRETDHGFEETSFA
ncbi:MAG: RHS repeat domain-containing protein, partial [Bradymonadaceae bacterium]